MGGTASTEAPPTSLGRGRRCGGGGCSLACYLYFLIPVVWYNMIPNVFGPAAKFAVNFLMEMRKRPIAHWDPALAAAHVLLSHRAPYELADTQTSIVLRDVMDNVRAGGRGFMECARVRVG